MSMKTKGASRDFPIVCVGGSAGGLDAYTRLLQHLPADMGVAIVIVNHLRKVATLLHEILPRYTKMPVELISEKLLIEPNHVFIIPEKRDLHVLNGEFRLEPISKPWGWPDVITIFLRSLTQYWDGKLIAVIVSGYDGDGAAALCGIREVGGITIAQKPERRCSPICLRVRSKAVVSTSFFPRKISRKRLCELPTPREGDLNARSFELPIVCEEAGCYHFVVGTADDGVVAQARIEQCVGSFEVVFMEGVAAV